MIMTGSQGVHMNKHYEVKKFNKDEIIFKEGSKGAEAFVIKSGFVEIQKNINGNDVLLAILGKGNIFGEMALMNNEVRTATAISSEDTELVVVGKKQYAALLDQSPKIISSIVTSLIERLDETSSRLSMTHKIEDPDLDEVIFDLDEKEDVVEEEIRESSDLAAEELIPGMYLAQDVKKSNAVIIKAGTRLTPSVIEKLRHWDIHSVSIVGHH